MFKRFFQGPQHELPEGCYGVAQEESKLVRNGGTEKLRTVTKFACAGLPEQGELSLNPTYDHRDVSMAGAEKHHARAAKTAIAATCATCVLGPGNLQRAAVTELDRKITLAELEKARLERIQALLDQGISPEVINATEVPALEAKPQEPEIE